MVVAAGPAIEGFSNVCVRFDFPARNGLTKFGVADFPGIERFAADAEKVSELLVGQSEQAHPIRAVGKLRSISTRTPNAARRAVRLAPAGLFRTGFRLGDVHQRTGNKRGFPCALYHRDTRSYKRASTRRRIHPAGTALLARPGCPTLTGCGSFGGPLSRPFDGLTRSDLGRIEPLPLAWSGDRFQRISPSAVRPHRVGSPTHSGRPPWRRERSKMPICVIRR